MIAWASSKFKFSLLTFNPTLFKTVIIVQIDII